MRSHMHKLNMSCRITLHCCAKTHFFSSSSYSYPLPPPIFCSHASCMLKDLLSRSSLYFLLVLLLLLLLPCQHNIYIYFSLFSLLLQIKWNNTMSFFYFFEWLNPLILILHYEVCVLYVDTSKENDEYYVMW